MNDLSHKAAWFTLSDPGAAGAWVRIATITIEAQYRECEIYGRINQQSTINSTNCDVWSTRFSFTIRQQQALASAPATEFRLLKNRSTGDVKAYITQNDGSATVVKIFAFVPDCWSTRISYDVHYKMSDADVGIVLETSEQVEVPAGTEITGLTYLSNIDTLLLDDMAADPSAAGELQRNAADLKFHDGTAARTLLHNGDATKYVVRDATAYDFGIADFPNVGAWQIDGLDLSSIVPAGAVAAHVKILIGTDAAGHHFNLRRDGTNIHNSIDCEGCEGGASNSVQSEIIAINSDRKLDYFRCCAHVTAVNVAVLGWILAP